MPVRELALLLLIPGICLVALVKPKVGLLGYIWFAIVQPDVLAWCEGKYPFSLALAAATLIGSIRYLPKVLELLGIPIVQWVLLLQIPLGLSIQFCQGSFLSPDRYQNFERTAIMILLIPLLITTVQDMWYLIYTFAISEVMLGGRFGVFGLANGGALLDQPYGHLYDNNELALAVAMLVPICWYCRQAVSRGWVKVGLLLTMVASAGAVVLSNSRGSSLALATVFICLIARSRRRVGVFILVLLLVAPTIYLVRERYFARMATIKDYENEESAATRVELWGVAIKMWEDYPFTGVGFGNRNFARLSSRYLHRSNMTVAHNSYLQMLVDSGIFAFLIYCGLLFGSVFWLGKSAKFVRSVYPGQELIPIALQTSLLAYAAGATFYSHQRYDLFYILLLTTAAWYRIQKTELLAASPEDASMELAVHTT